MGLFNFGGKKVKNKKGKEVVLLNPNEKAAKYAAELRDGFRYTNSGDLKVDSKTGSVDLSREGRAYRAGYLDSRKDGAKVYKYNKAKGKK